MADRASAATAAGESGEGDRDQVFDYDRTVALSDGVFAIALTLLVLNIPQPSAGGDLWEKLGDIVPNLAAYALSFVVIASMWRYHHLFFRQLDRIDRRLTAINLVYLGMIALIPFPTGLIAERGSEAPAVIVYAATIAIVSSLGAAMDLHARHAGLTEPRSRSLLNYLLPPGVFLASIPIALIDPTLAIWSWLSLLVPSPILDRRDAARAGAVKST